MAMTITRKALERQAWPLREASDMFTALEELKELGWDGGLTHEQSAWKLRLSADGKNSVNATIREWLVLDDDLRVVSVSDFVAQYDSDTDVEFPAEEVAEPATVEENIISDAPETAVPLSRAVR